MVNLVFAAAITCLVTQVEINQPVKEILRGDGIYKSTDNGEHWEKALSPPHQQYHQTL